MAHRVTEATLRKWMQDSGSRLIALSTGICRDRHQAEEIVQEAFIKLWRNPPDAGEPAYASWLRKVVTNLSINALQRTRRPGPLPEFADEPSLQSSRQPETICGTAEELARVRAALARLDDTKRAILMLRAFEELSYDEIARYLGIPPGTVMSRLNRARAALMEELKRDRVPTDDEPMVYEFRKYKQA